MKLYRFLTDADTGDRFGRRVTQALNEGWSLHGAPTLCYDPARGAVICGQAVVREQSGAASPETPDRASG